MTEPREPITFPYRTTENRRSRAPILFAATNNLSEHSLVAHKLIGAAAICSMQHSLDLRIKTASIRFSAPRTWF